MLPHVPQALHAGVDCNAVHNLGSFACETDVPERGVLWRVLLLLLPLLGMEDPPAAGAGAGAGADAAQAEAASLPLPFTGEADEADGQDAMLARVAEAHRRAAARLGSAAWQRRLAARVLAALARMQARCRLPEDPLETIVSFLANEGQLQEREATALLCQVRRASGPEGGPVGRRLGLPHACRPQGAQQRVGGSLPHLLTPLSSCARAPARASCLACR